MTWGNRLLDPQTFEDQERAAKAAANPWGPRLGLPEPDAEPVPDVDAALPPAGDPPPPPELQLSVAAIEQRLAEQPGWWIEALDYELNRAAPRKSALRAILRTGREENGPAALLETGEAVLAQLAAAPADEVPVTDADGAEG